MFFWCFQPPQRSEKNVEYFMIFSTRTRIRRDCKIIETFIHLQLHSCILFIYFLALFLPVEVYGDVIVSGATSGHVKIIL